MSAASAATRAQRDVVRGIADAAARSLDAGDLSGSINQLIHAMRACVSTAAEELPALPRVPSVLDEPGGMRGVYDERRSHAAPRRASVVLYRNSRPVRCTDCPEGTSPHQADWWLQWGQHSSRQGRAVCARNAFAAQVGAIEMQESAVARGESPL